MFINSINSPHEQPQTFNKVIDRCVIEQMPLWIMYDRYLFYVPCGYFMLNGIVTFSIELLTVL